MRIRKLRLKNGYKRFHDLTIDLGGSPARIVALIGPNGCGKSSVLDGMLYYHGGHGKRLGIGRVGVEYHSMNSDPAFNHTSVEIEFVEGSYLEVHTRRAQMGMETALFSFRSPYRYNNSLKVKETRATVDIRLNSYGASNASALDGKMEESYRRLLAMTNNYMEQHDVKPSEARELIIGELNNSIRNCLEIEIVSVGNVEGDKGTLYFKKPDQQKEFEFNVLSSGEKEVIDLLLDLYLRKDDYTETVFLIDEPELHINTSIQGKLLVEIEKLVGEDCQIWLTTHSIGFLKALQTEMKDKCQIIQFKDEYELASSPLTLTPMKATVHAWRDLFSVALDDLAGLVAPKTIIYCEGRADPKKAGGERGMDAQVFNNIFGECEPDTLFVSSGGNTELDQRSAIAIAILGKALPTVEFLVLKDRDMASGKNTTEKDRQLYLQNNEENHRVLKRWEIENYLYDKDVLKAYCASNDLQFDETGYDTFVTSIADQDLKDSTGRIKSYCNLKGSLSAEKFKISLSGYLTEALPVFSELRDCVFGRR